MPETQNRITLLSNGHPLNEISVKTLVGYLEAQGVPCRSIYLNAATELTPPQSQKLLELCEGSQLVGFSLMSKDVKTLLPISAALRERGDRAGGVGTPVLWGGVHATALPQDALQHCDFVCVGEGELTLHQLYTHLKDGNTDYAAIPNLAYHADGRHILPQVFHSEPSLDALPFPDYEFKDTYLLSRGGEFLQVPAAIENRRRFFGMSGFLFYSQRGCPFSCAYCSNSLYHTIAKKTSVRWYRTASPARIKEEIRHHLKFVTVRDALTINDDDFVTRPVAELEEIGHFLKHELGLRFNINATPSAVTREKMAVLAKYGLLQIAMGVQTGSKRILHDVYNRHVYAEQVLKAAHIISEFYKDGVVADYGFILENPYETPEDHRATIKLFLAMPRPFNVSLYSLAFFPGTILTNKALAENVIRPDEISLDKDYRQSIRPSFFHLLFGANYKLKIPDEINQILLSDNVLIAERKQYARLLLANYFLSDAVKRIVRLRAPAPATATQPPASQPQAELVEFLTAVAAILRDWSDPARVIHPTDGAEDLILQYPNPAAPGKMLEIGFAKNQIIRLGSDPVAATSPINALTQ